MELLLIAGLFGLFGLFFLICCVVGMTRAHWVYIKRMEIITDNHKNLNDYISDDDMYKKFWCWNIEKMKIKKVTKKPIVHDFYDY